MCRYHSPVSLTDQQLRLLQDAHRALFSELLKIRATWLRCVFDEAEKNYLVVPLYFIPFFQPMEAYIDFDSARLLAGLRSSQPGGAPVRTEDSFTPISWPLPPGEEFHNTIMVRKYNTSPLFQVLEVSRDVSLSSPCPFSSGTYGDYFRTKYECRFTDDSQPALRCKPLGESGARLQLLTSRFKMPDGTDVKKSESRIRREVELFPEVCLRYPLPADLWRLARCLPSVLWRVESVLATEALRGRVSAGTGVGVLPDGSQLVTCSAFRGYRDAGFGNLETQRWWCPPDFPGVDEGETRAMTAHDPLKPPLRGPDNVLLLQALTTRQALDSVNLERLETLGDSFLKFSVTIFLFLDRGEAHEGRLSTSRARRVCNQNLYRLARRRGIAEAILSTTFDPLQMWTPPCFVFDESDPNLSSSSSAAATMAAPPSATPSSSSVTGGSPSSLRRPQARDGLSEQARYYLYHRLTDKAVADCVESLTGAYLVSGGILAGLKFLAWMGVKIQRRSDNSNPLTTTTTTPDASRHSSMESNHSEEGEVSSSCSSSGSYRRLPHTKRPKLDWRPPIYVQDSAGVLTRYFGPLPVTRTLGMAEGVELERMLSVSMGPGGGEVVEGALGWRFRDRTLLLQAITHASYARNRLTGCYQRLEFLGDAVLDYLVTCHIYSTFPGHGPGEITSLRSALVNNHTFAEFVVGMRLQACLLYSSPSLYKQIERYLKCEGGRDTGPEEKEEVGLLYKGVADVFFGMAICNRASAPSVCRDHHWMWPL